MRYRAIFRWTPQMHRWIRRGCLAGTAIAGLVAVGVHAQLGKSDWASWVQAVGSIGAIFAVVAAVRLDHRHQREAEREEARENAVRSLDDAIEMLLELSGLMSAGYRNATTVAGTQLFLNIYGAQRVENLRRIAEAYPWQDIRPIHLASHLLAGLQAFDVAARQVEHARSGSAVLQPLQIIAMNSCFENALRRINESISEFRRTRKVRGGS